MSVGIGRRLSWPDRYFTIYNEISYQAYNLKDWSSFLVTNGKMCIRDRVYGHVNGVESMRKVIRAAMKWGVKYLTAYAFSTENWGRPREEVDALMELLCRTIADETDELDANGVRIRFIGQTDVLSDVCLLYTSRCV